ncbi:SET domain-containing protein [Sistotremastrum suecicum HHB10207 ss-3]|uniref:SET domain-containing protein n=1 Tax=Sistotremastrum suecicum HHB10207 ss-3 TaxID=1314776 RepID=A0A166BCP6_9AGAM|nr:SET domain-containing protein [Sistotremastrum suecicum HHB10207 ss-3]
MSAPVSACRCTICLSENDSPVTTATKILHQVQAEFSEWNKDECQRLFASLGLDEEREEKENSGPSSVASFDIWREPSNPSSTTWTVYVGNEERVQQLSCPVVTCETVRPAPSYEWHTETNQNIWVSLEDTDTLAFVPFADDPSFRAEEYTSCFKRLKPCRDPDLEEIEAEAARRLHFGHGFSFDLIDKTGVLSRTMLGESENVGICHALTQRDRLQWPGSMNSPYPPLLSAAPQPPQDLATRVIGLVKTFCPAPRCNHYFCPEHAFIAPVPQPAPPSTTTEEDIQRKKSCGQNCYLNDVLGLNSWSSTEIMDFQTVLRLMPDTSPCDLAIIVQKPCRQVYQQKWALRTLMEQEEVPVDNKRLKRKRKNPRRFDDKDPVTFSYGLPCDHEGSCEDNPKCDIRHKGCKCVPIKGIQTCRTNKCPCFRARRECDPYACGDCEWQKTEKRDTRTLPAEDTSTLSGSKSPPDPAPSCQNCYLTLGLQKEINVGLSKWGFGAFIAEPAEPGDYIAQYTGEFISQEHADLRGSLSDHVKRNYRFELNPLWLVDACSMGNGTRFINHSNDDYNCRAVVVIIDGDHCLAIYAIKQLKEGDELLLNYGEEYFIDGNEKTASSTVPEVP